MTDEQWLAGTNPKKMLTALRAAGRPSPRKLRLFACACVRRLHHQPGEAGLLPCIEVAEAFADGTAGKPARVEAERRVRRALHEGGRTAAVAVLLAT